MRNKHASRREGGHGGRGKGSSARSSNSLPKKDNKPDKNKGLSNHFFNAKIKSRYSTRCGLRNSLDVSDVSAVSVGFFRGEAKDFAWIGTRTYLMCLT